MLYRIASIRRIGLVEVFFLIWSLDASHEVSCKFVRMLLYPKYCRKKGLLVAARIKITGADAHMRVFGRIVSRIKDDRGKNC